MHCTAHLKGTLHLVKFKLIQLLFRHEKCWLDRMVIVLVITILIKTQGYYEQSFEKYLKKTNYIK